MHGREPDAHAVCPEIALIALIGPATRMVTTTYRYMHLSPAAREGPIRLLDRRDDGAGFGEMLETARAAE